MEKDNQIQLIGAAGGLRRRASDFIRVDPPDSTERLRESWRAIRKRQRGVVCIIGVVFAAIAIWTFQQRPMYEAKGMLEIEEESPNIVTVQELFQIENPDDDYLGTQYKILQSDTLARQVIKELHLDQREEFNPRENAGKAAVFGRRKKKGQEFLTNAAHEQHVLRRFEDRLTVEPIQRSRLVRVSFDSEDPQLAAKVVNTLAKVYIQENARMHLDAAQKASVWLTGQLNDAKLKLEKSENELQGYANANGLLYLQKSDGETENIVDQRLREVQDELSRAEADRYQREALFRLAEAGDYGALPGVFDNKVLQDLLDRLADLERQQAALAPEFKADYPKMKDIKSQIEQTERFLQQQRQQAERHIADEYFAAVHREDLVNRAFRAEQKNANAVAQKSVQYNILKRDVDTNKQIYDGLLQHSKEAGVSSALSSSNLRVIDAAVPPASPAKPRIGLNLAFGLLLGAMSGAMLALVQERVDNTLKSAEDVEQSLRIPVLGIIPLKELGKQSKASVRHFLAFKRSATTGLMKLSQSGGRWLSVDARFEDGGEIREAFRALRTSVLLSGAGRPPRSIAVTSAEIGEGKTTVCCNLASLLASIGKRVLVIDADIRNAQVQDFFGLDGSAGLANYLAGEEEWRSLVQVSKVKGVDCLICGPELPNPGEFLSSERMVALMRGAMDQYDFVLVDSPPLLNLADGRIVATVVEGTILVVRGGSTSRECARQAQACAANVGARVIGVVLNGIHAGHLVHGGFSKRALRNDKTPDARVSA